MVYKTEFIVNNTVVVEYKWGSRIETLNTAFLFKTDDCLYWWSWIGNIGFQAKNLNLVRGYKNGLQCDMERGVRERCIVLN